MQICTDKNNKNMDELNDWIMENHQEDIPTGDEVVDVDLGQEQQIIAVPTDQELITGSNIVSPELPEIEISYAEDPATDPYNEQESNEPEYGSCDCRSECRYNTGHTYKYASYGYSG